MAKYEKIIYPSGHTATILTNAAGGRRLEVILYNGHYWRFHSNYKIMKVNLKKPSFSAFLSARPDWAIYWTLGNNLFAQISHILRQIL